MDNEIYKMSKNLNEFEKILKQRISPKSFFSFIFFLQQFNFIFNINRFVLTPKT